MPGRGGGGGTQFRWRGVLDTTVKYSRNSWVEYTVGGVRLGFVAPTSIPANSPAPDQANTLVDRVCFVSADGPARCAG